VAINVGSTTSATYEGVTYQADKYSTGGTPNSTTDRISGPSDGTLFQTERYGSFSYRIPVTSGTFSVKLHMAEIYWTAAGSRTFNVSIENQVVLPNLDLFSQVGHDGAFDYEVRNIRVTDGALDIKLDAVTDNATLSGFAIFSADGKLDTSVPEPTCSGYVGITFDDGPSGNTNAFVDALKQSGLVPVTFFVNGNNIGNNSAGIRKMLEAGEVQSHGFTHDDMSKMSYQQVTDQLTRNNQAIQNAGAPKPTIVRPPYGAQNDTVRQAAAAQGMIVVNWDVDSQDWNGASTSAIVNSASRLQPGQVILMHENQRNSLSAIPQIAANLKSRGLCAGKLDPRSGRAVAP
jgi:peptidoglycan/xylan/chitin deacetylase (PgdA/CDA1 family)